MAQQEPTCPECFGNDVVYKPKTNELICKTCGAITPNYRKK